MFHTNASLNINAVRSGRYLVLLILVCSRHSDKYIRKGRLNWPEGCTSRESMKAVMKLSRLQVCLNNDRQNMYFCL
jgi:hypothetical protein